MDFIPSMALELPNIGNGGLVPFLFSIFPESNYSQVGQAFLAAFVESDIQRAYY